MTASTNTLSKQQQRVLAQLGIDIWVRRGSSADIAGPAPAERAPVRVVDGPAENAAPAPATSTRDGEAPNVQLDCWAAPGIVIVGELTDRPDRRIAQDIVLAVAGAAAQLQHTAFRWPLTQTGDAGLAAARNAYRGFLRGQTERAAARWLLLLGTTSTLLLDADVEGAESAVGGLRTLRLPGASALRADPVAKQRLWLSVSQQDRS